MREEKFLLQRCKLGVGGLIEKTRGEIEKRLAGRKAAATARSSSIIRTIHIVWIGDENKNPTMDRQLAPKKSRLDRACIGATRLTTLEMGKSQAHQRNAEPCRVAGVADMMRWEILDKHGGLRWMRTALHSAARGLLFEAKLFACWENEIHHSRLIAKAMSIHIPQSADPPNH